MKIVIIIITACILQVSASTKAQQITLNVNNASLKKVFSEIRNQTGYDVFYKSEQILHAKSVTVEIKNIPLNEALNIILKNQNLSYVIEDNAIVIHELLTTPTSRSPAPARIIDSTSYVGRVIDQDGNPLPGATVRIKGTNRVTSTTADGNFVVYAEPGSTIVVTYIGYNTAELSLKKIDPSLRNIRITLMSTSQALSEIKVGSDGYEALPRERSTGSFQVLSAKDLAHSTSTDLLTRLDGITTSLNFNPQLKPTNSATKPLFNSSLTALTIRGRNTFGDPNEAPIGLGGNPTGIPLVVIDGIASPYSPDQIAPSDVEDITILKDAAAASIWGSRAANGVIVIRTKKGKYKHKPQINFNSSLTFIGKPNLFYGNKMSISDYVDAQVYAFKQAGVKTPAPNVNVSQLALTPVQEIMNSEALGQLSGAQGDHMLDSLKQHDVRNDLNKFFLRTKLCKPMHLPCQPVQRKHRNGYLLHMMRRKTIQLTITIIGSMLLMPLALGQSKISSLQLKLTII